MASDTSLRGLKLQLERHHDALNRLFEEYDSNGDGRISRREFHRAIAQLDLDTSKAAVDALFSHADVDGCNYIAYRTLHSALSDAAPLHSPQTRASARPTPKAMTATQTDLTAALLRDERTECAEWKERALAAEGRAAKLEDDALSARERIVAAEEEASRVRSATANLEEEAARARARAATADEEAARARAHTAEAVAAAGP